MLLSQWMVAATSLVSADMNWLGGYASYNTTEGNDFWLTFMTNNATEANNPSLNLTVYIVAEDAVNAIVEVGGSQVGTITVPAGGGFGKLEHINPQSAYLAANDSETRLKRGVHVYTRDKKAFFSCYALAEAGSGVGSTRDASLILPTRTLDREYFVQTYQNDTRATEFAVVVTEDNTDVTITPKTVTSKKTQAGQAITLTNLKKGEVYLVRSDDPSETENVDLSGSSICANKPVAVFQGNEAAKIASGNTGAYSANHAFEQTLPAARWGKEFYLGLTDHATWNFYNIIAAYDNTSVTISGLAAPLVLNAGQTLDEALSLVNSPVLVEKDVKITSDKPVMVNTYLSCGGANQVIERVNGKTVTNNWGNSTSAMMPGWEMRVNHMSFYTDTIAFDTKATSSGHMLVQVIAKSSDSGTFTLDGSPVPSSAFTALTVDASMSVANIELTDEGKHTLESSGAGFVGFVYAITSEARAYQYTLGYNPEPERDSLYITNSEVLMSHASYDMDSLDGHGWYQRQWKEWVEGRLDTAIVCDSSTVKWSIETPADHPVESIEWSLFDVTDGAHTLVQSYPKYDNPAETVTKHVREHQFILPEEEPENRHQFFEYELQAVLHRDRVLCDGEQLDTFRTTTRVTRVFNDTMFYALCVGDTLPFFNDSLYSQADLTQYRAGEKQETKFAATKSTDISTTDWQWNITPGAHEFQRRYESQFGCDSIVTLEVFVCDTFRQVDTVHLCYNQDTLYHGKKFRGRDYLPQRVDIDTTVLFVENKTKFCECQLETYPDKKRYVDLDGKPFAGCDSIYELHLIVHRSWIKSMLDTLDYTEHPDSTYSWQIEREGVTLDSLITRTNPAMKWNPMLQAWLGTFSDTLRTKTCAECNGGNPQGCDSINSLTLIIPPVYYYYDTVTWCRLHYDWTRHTTTRQDFQWKGHHNDIVYTRGGDYEDVHVSRYGCDSIYYLHLVYSQAEEPLYDPIFETVCLDTINRTRTWTSSDGVVNTDTIRQDAVGTFYYVDESRCDTIYELKLQVLPTYMIVKDTMITEEEVYVWPIGDTIRYGGPKATEPFDKPALPGVTRDTLFLQTEAVNGRECDSIHILILRMGEVYRDTVDTFVCGQENHYDWIGKDHDGNDSLRMTIPLRQLPAPGTTKTYLDEHYTVLGFDSIFYLNLYRAPIHDSIDTYRVCQTPGGTFDWPKHGAGHVIYDALGNQVTAIPTEKFGFYQYTDTLPTDSFGCDSIWHLQLYVDSVYHYTFVDTTCQFENYVWPNQDADSIDRPILTDHVGDYIYTASYHSIYGCDSVWTLQLHIDTVYTTYVTPTDTFMCDKDSIVFIGETVYGDKSPNKPTTVPGIAIPDGQQFVEVDLDGFVPSSLGCDSAVRYHLTVYKTYYQTEDSIVCQPSEGRDSLFRWTNHSKVWDVHNSRYISADSIPRYVKGDTVYTYIDSLRTTTCTLCDQIKGGCDSLFILHLRIDSTYHFYDTVHMCENERYTEWQRISFAGDSVADIDLDKDSVLKPGVYDFRLRYPAVTACDSTYYLHLYVHPVYHTVIPHTFCDNDTAYDAHYFTFTDTKGTNITDYLRYEPHGQVPERDTATTHYDIRHYTLEHTLKTVDGCDSVVTHTFTILPTYEFVARGKGCFADTVYWRGGKYYTSGIYYDRLKTEVGCDSIFVLEFLVKPVVTIPIYDTICDNETYVHTDTLWYTSGAHTTFDELVWKPGMAIPQTYTEVLFRSPLDGCDSIRYRYYLTIYKSYNFEVPATICSGEPFYYEFNDHTSHTWYGTMFEYDTDVYVEPFDTLFSDTLTTVLGCDSIVSLRAHLLPTYRHTEYDSICANDSLLWREHWFKQLEAGDTIVRDTLSTIHGCDSIYEIYLHIHPKYFDERHERICENHSYTWYDDVLSGFEPGEYVFMDTLQTDHGCDSVFHLYLKVIPISDTVLYDTICYMDTLFMLDHQYTEAGLYVDTTVNSLGCDSIIYTHLELIPPTVPTIWAQDPMCQNQTAFELYYSYTNREPISYSLLFDSIGLSMGFENQLDIPITQYTSPMVITVPIPYGDENDPTTYPTPNNYSVHLILDNGICRHKERDCYHDSTFVMHYPAWITEQRFGDIIALLNADNNGGYSWIDYQWYQDGQPLVGQTRPYLYIPTGLNVGSSYHVALTRVGETKAFESCPIEAITNPVGTTYSPTMGYLSVTPTCVVTANPVTNILSRKDGTYRITTSSGRFVSQGVFRADTTPITLPSASGLYIVQLWSYDTPEEPYRAIKVIVRDKCPNCATSSF